MIVVNNPGTWSAVYPPLLHADWHGWTYTDTIFPFFLFVVGAAIPFSFGRRASEGADRNDLLRHTARRALWIVAIGLALNLLSFLLFQREHLRIPGVLQRIGLCFLAAAAIWLFGGTRAAAIGAVLLLAGYWALMALVPVPGFGVGRYDLQGNLAAYVDRIVLGAHTWKPGWDPEGPLSTLPAIATTLLGVLAGSRLRSESSGEQKVRALIFWGWAAALAGLAWGLVFPINKNLWTSSYALFMSGLATACLAVCYWAIDIRSWRRAITPFLWLGRNAIGAFVASTVVTIVLIAIKVPGPEGKPRSLWSTIYRAVFDRFADPRLGSLLFALAYLGVWLLIFRALDRRRLYWKI
jgi:predicted acyltransferase